MSLKMVVGEDYPRGHWMLDDVSPYADYSGYEREAATPALVNLALNPHAATTFGMGSGGPTILTASIGTDTVHGTYYRSTSGVAANVPHAIYFGVNTPGRADVEPGKTYSASLVTRYRNTTATANMYLRFRWFDASGALIFQTGGNTVVVPKDTWVTLTATKTAPAGAVKVSIDSYITSMDWAVGDYMDATKMILVEGSERAEYFDGSTLYLPEKKNLISAPATTLGNSVITDAVSYDGDQWRRFTANTANHGVRWQMQLSEFENNELYVPSVEVANDGAEAVSVSMDLADIVPVIMKTVQPGERLRLYGPAVTREFSQTYRFLDLTASPVGSSVLFRNAMVTKGTQHEQYFDGDSVDNSGYAYAWTGTPYQSSSVMYRADQEFSWTGTPNESPSTTAKPMVFGTSLVKGAERSLIVSNSSRLSVSTPVFKQGKEYLTFSVEAFVRPIFSDPANIAEQQIWGNDGVMDGLTINGTVVSFVTKYTDGSEARASFDLMDDQSFAAVGIHTDRKNILYINGEQVAEVVITPEQKLSTFVATGENQSCGASTSPNSLMMNSLSVYDLELDEESALTHYANAQDVLGAEDVAIDYKGALLEFAPEGQLAPFFQIEYSSDAEWQLGTRVNCAINDGTLYPSVSQGVSVPGYWETVVPLGASENQIYAANLIWEGVGATVTTSRDGELYEPAQKGKALVTVPKGTNGENEFLFIRVAFEGGMANDPSFFDNMVFSLYTTGTISNFSGREVVLDKATPEDDLDVIDFQENWGVELEGGTVTIKAPVGDMGIKARTIEVWGLKNGTWTNNLGAAKRIRTNGGTQQSWRTGEWQLFHYVFDADFAGDIVFSGTGQIGHVVLYPEALSDEVIKEIYDSYTGKPKIQVEVDEVFDVHEFPGAVDIYEYDWSIESSG